jgi:hypothetical protein
MSKKITLAKIREITLASFAKTNKFPSPLDRISFDDIGYPGEAVGALNSAMRTGGRSLDLDPEWILLKNSLPDGIKPSLAMLDPSNEFTIAKIKTLAIKSMNIHGQFPTVVKNTGFFDVGYPDETASSINSAMRSGSRGLKRDPDWKNLCSILPPGVMPTLAMLDPFHNLTMSMINEMTRSFVTTHGFFPSVAKKMRFDECGYPGETALAIDSSMRLGGRGLNLDPEWISLQKELPHGVVPTLACLSRKPYLTIEYIKKVANASHDKHRIFPSSLRDTHFDDVGYPGEKATAFDSSLASGGRGLHRDSEWVELKIKLEKDGKKPSLSMFNPSNNLTLQKIRDIAQSYVDRFGVFPSSANNSKFDTVGFPGESVDSLNSAMRRGGRGLIKDIEWMSLKKSLPKCEVPTFSMLDPFHNLTIDSLRNILNLSIDKNGVNPSTTHKTTFEDIGFPGETASSLNSAIRRGGRGLSRDPEWIKMKSDLPEGKEPSLTLVLSTLSK